MVEASAASAAVGEGAAPEKTVVFGVDSLFMEVGWFVALPQASLFILLVFYFSLPVFCFHERICG